MNTVEQKSIEVLRRLLTFDPSQINIEEDLESINFLIKALEETDNIPDYFSASEFQKNLCREMYKSIREK